MKKYNTIYYLLFVLIITGAFASMALNTYGMKLIGFSCLGFSLVFLYEAVFGIRKRSDLNPWNRKALLMELVFLSLISLLFFFRSLLISFPYAEGAFIVTLLLLIGIYLFIAYKNINELWHVKKVQAIGLSFYFSSLILFAFTFLVGILFPEHGIVTAILGLLFLILYFIIGVSSRRMIIKGEGYSLFNYTMSMKNKTTLVFVAILMIFSFYSFRDANLIPAMYSGDTPTGYLRLIQEAEAGQENQEIKVNKYLQFKEQYDRFIEKYGN